MPNDTKQIIHPEDVISNPQILFEGAVLAVIAHVIETGARVDLAVSDYLARFPMDDGYTHLRPDMIICVSDCLRLVRHVAGSAGDARPILDEAIRVWRDTDNESRLSVNDRTTRIQACIGNIRRVLGSTA